MVDRGISYDQSSRRQQLADEADADNIARPLLVHGARLGPGRDVGTEDRGALPMTFRAALL